jgi:hypothetical protein
MRDYYNRRLGTGGDSPRLTLEELARQVSTTYAYFTQHGYLQWAFGYNCVDAGDVPGKHGTDIATQFYLKTGIRLDGALPELLSSTSEVNLFTFIEFVYDYVAKPDERTGRYHSFSGCGWHYDCRSEQFDFEAARMEWRSALAEYLRYYSEGYELTARGEVAQVAPSGLSTAIEATAPPAAGETNIAKLEHAVRAFLRGRSSREDKKRAVRELADLLEFYRPQVKKHLLSKDESDLFHIANTFAIRHHNENQRTDYDGPWLTWLFYLYLTTVHLVMSLVHNQEGGENSNAEVPF